jgi:REP-associated tyrosine transposase
MPRTARASVGDICYHVVNRGNAQIEVFHKDGDYRAFVELIGLACQRIPMRVLAYCVMPNHFHLALWPRSDKDLGRWMQWLLTAHVRCYQHYCSSGQVWQGRFKAFPIEQDDHLLTVLRYVERNPLRAGLVEQAENWRWSSLHHWRVNSSLNGIDPGPVPRPERWIEWDESAALSC